MTLLFTDYLIIIVVLPGLAINYSYLYDSDRIISEMQLSHLFAANRRKNNSPIVGFIFETLCIRDLRVFADALNGEVYHYRDKDGQECDAVIHLRNGRYGLIEIKLGGDKLIEDGVYIVPIGCLKN